MRIQHLKLEEFRCFKAAEVDFSADVTAIYGRNGIGKTTLFDAIEFALFGSVMRLEEFGDTVDYITRIESDIDPLVQLTLQDDSSAIEIATTWNREAQSVGAIRGSRSWPNHREMLYSILVDRDSLGSRHEVAAVRELFRATLMLSQQSIRDFVEASAEGRARVLAGLAGLAHIQRSKDKAESVAELAERQANALARQIESATATEREASARRNESEARAAARRQRLSPNRVSVEDLREAATAVDIALTDEASILRQATELRVRAEEIQGDLEARLTRVATLESGQVTQRERMARLETISLQSKELRRRRAELQQRVSESAEHKEALETRLDAFRREGSEMSAKLERLQSARSEAQKINRVRAQLEQLDLRHHENQVRTAESHVASALRQRADALAAKDAATVRVTELQERADRLRPLEQPGR